MNISRLATLIYVCDLGESSSARSSSIGLILLQRPKYLAKFWLQTICTPQNAQLLCYSCTVSDTYVSSRAFSCSKYISQCCGLLGKLHLLFKYFSFKSCIGLCCSFQFGFFALLLLYGFVKLLLSWLLSLVSCPYSKHFTASSSSIDLENFDWEALFSLSIYRYIVLCSQVDCTHNSPHLDSTSL